MMIIQLSPPLDPRKEPLARLPKRYGISFPELFERCFQLGIQPQEIRGALYIDGPQLKRLDALYRDFAGIGEAFLYRCSKCGDLWLVDTPLHTHRDQLRLCDGGKRKSSFHVGTFEFIASGPHDEVSSLAHSIILGLDNPMKGP